MDGRRDVVPGCSGQRTRLCGRGHRRRSKTSVAAFGRFFAHYKRVPEALRAVLCCAPTPAVINALAAKRSNPKRTPMDRKTLLAAMTGALALAMETAQAMADSSDSELADARRVFLSPGALPACSEGAAARWRRKTAPSRRTTPKRSRVHRRLQDARRALMAFMGKLDAHAKAQNGGLTAEAALRSHGHHPRRSGQGREAHPCAVRRLRGQRAQKATLGRGLRRLCQAALPRD